MKENVEESGVVGGIKISPLLAALSQNVRHFSIKKGNRMRTLPNNWASHVGIVGDGGGPHHGIVEQRSHFQKEKVGDSLIRGEPWDFSFWGPSSKAIRWKSCKGASNGPPTPKKKQGRKIFQRVIEENTWGGEEKLPRPIKHFLSTSDEKKQQKGRRKKEIDSGEVGAKGLGGPTLKYKRNGIHRGLSAPGVQIEALLEKKKKKGKWHIDGCQKHPLVKRGWGTEGIKLIKLGRKKVYRVKRPFGISNYFKGEKPKNQDPTGGVKRGET